MYKSYWGDPIPGRRIICGDVYRLHFEQENISSFQFWDYSWDCNACLKKHCSNCYYEGNGEDIYVYACERFK